MKPVNINKTFYRYGRKTAVKKHLSMQRYIETLIYNDLSIDDSQLIHDEMNREKLNKIY